jgi:DNA-binding SARP family transcriptional activator/tetratricopeptide (TPR) repeat protein
VVTLRLFGPPLVRGVDGVEIRLRSRKQLGVLVYLIVERDRAVSRDELIDAFWGDVPHERAYQSLCQALVEIRRAIGRAGVESRGDAIRIAIPTSTDVEVLAQDLERRDLAHPLQDMEWWGTAALGHWLERSRAWVNRMARDVLLQGIAENRRAGATLRVHRCAELLYELDPLSEPAAFALTERELLKGDVVAGIRFLRAHAGRVAGTLGCQPQPEIERLLRRLEAGAHPPIELVPKRLAAHAAQVRPTILVGRERELAFLEGEWQRVREERRLRTCVVQGPAGIGKSSLVRRFAATVASRAQPVFMVSCQEIGERIPFAATADLVEELLRDPAVSATDPVWLAEVSRIHPGVRQQYPGVPEPLDVPAETIRLRIAEGLMRMLESISDGVPLLLVFDDAPNMDPATRDVTAVLARRARDFPLLIILSGRSTSDKIKLGEVSLFGAALRDLTPLQLSRLDDDALVKLIYLVAPTVQLTAPDVVERIVQMSEGNPHFVELLLADWQRHTTSSLAAGRRAHELPDNWTPPSSLHSAFAMSYAGLSEITRKVVHVLAVAQRALSPEEVASTLDIGTAVLDQAVLQLLSQGLLRVEAGELGFKSELQRAFAFIAMGTEARSYFHGMLARSIRDRAGHSHFRYALESGQHFLHSGNTKEAARLTWEGARSAIRAGASVEAEAFLLALARTVTGPQLSRTLLLLAEAQAEGNRPRECMETLKAIDQGGLTIEGTFELECLRCRANTELRSAPATELMDSLGTVLRRSLSAGHVELGLTALQLLAELAAEAGSMDRLASLQAMCEGLSNSENVSHAARAALSLGFMALAQGQFERAQNIFSEASQTIRGGECHVPVRWRLLSGLSLTQTCLGDYAGAEATLAALEESASAVPGERSPILWSNIAVFHQEMGRFGRAAIYFDRAIRALTDFPSPREHAVVLSSAASFAMDLGYHDLADSCLLRAEAATTASHIARDRLDTLLVRADFYLTRREYELAWILMQDSVVPMGDRAYAIGESARHERLARHLTYALSGMDAYCSARTQRAGLVKLLPMHGRVELACLDDWISERERCLGTRTSSALERAISGGFLGVVFHLAAVGCLPNFPASGPHNLTTAQQLTGQNPVLAQVRIPEALDWTLPSFL